MLTVESSQTICETHVSFNQQISNQIDEKGWAVIDDYLPCRTIQELKEESQLLFMEQTAWINPEKCYPAQSDVLQSFQKLRHHLNRENHLGLSELELQACVLPRQGHHKKQFDNFQSSGKKILTVILYLNQQWQPSDEGQLRIYLKNNMSIDIAPIGGRLVTFLSNTFEYETLPAQVECYSLEGWFRRSVFPV